VRDHRPHLHARLLVCKDRRVAAVRTHTPPPPHSLASWCGAQVLSMFARSRIRWPKFLRDIFLLMSAFNLNLELTAPECLMPEIAYWQKWFFIESLPLAACSIFVVIHFGKFLYKKFIKRVKSNRLWSHTPTLVSTSIVIMRMLYLYLTRTSFVSGGAEGAVGCVDACGAALRTCAGSRSRFRRS
jgi:hypothetical protein